MPELNREWIQEQLEAAKVKVGSGKAILKVKLDAFAEKLGTIHNGRRGVVIGIRYGDVIVNDTDKKSPPLKGVHYSPYKLEKRIRKA